jgi:glycosyltransferase involved in cell wall biosynthesis
MSHFGGVELAVAAKKTKAPRVCMITEGFYPPTIGGQQKYVHDLAVKLVANGLEVMVITRQSDPPAQTREVVDRVAVIRVPPGGQFTGKGWHALIPLVLFLGRVFWRLVKEHRHYDIMLISGLKMLPIPATVVSILLNKRLVIRPESPIELWQDFSAKSMQRMRIRQSSRLVAVLRSARYGLVRRADRIVAISSQIKAGLLDARVKPDRIVQIPNGIDISRICPAERSEKARLREGLHLPLDKHIFVYTGRLTTSKGIPELIHAWQQITQQHHNTLLLLVGSGADCFDDCEPQLKQFIAENDLQPYVTLAGAVTDVSPYLRAADVFVFPSHYEGFGLSIIEAMACGLPSVVTKVGVALDVLQSDKNGIAINSKEEDDLKSAILWLLDHVETWSDMGGQACRDVVSRYSMDAVAGQYMTVFTDIQRLAPTHARSPFKRTQEGAIGGE